jgi:hypothetical protein
MTKPHAFRHSHTEYLQEEYKKILSLNSSVKYALYLFVN